MIIGIMGLAGVGKDTAADFLVKDEDFVKVSFADPLKRICREIYGFSPTQLWGPSAERNKPDPRYPRQHTWMETTEKGAACTCCGVSWVESDTRDPPRCFLTPRFALQRLGTEWGRTCYPNTWVDHALRAANRLLKKPRRHTWYTPENGIWEEEIGRPAALQGVVIPDCRFQSEVDALKTQGGYVVRINRPSAGLKGAQSQHRSETEQRDVHNVDVTLENIGTLEDLRTQIRGAFKRLASREGHRT